MAKIVELIYTNNDRRGKGELGSPIRRIEQWFEKDGTLVFEKDPCDEDKPRQKLPNYDEVKRIAMGNKDFPNVADVYDIIKKLGNFAD